MIREIIAMTMLIPGPAAITLLLITGSADVISFSSGSTNAPSGMIKNSAPTELSFIPCLLATTPWNISWIATAAIIVTTPYEIGMAGLIPGNPISRLSDGALEGLMLRERIDP